MEPSALNSILLIQGSSAFLLFLVFRFLYVEGRERYFFAWQIAWGLFAVYSLCQLLIGYQTAWTPLIYFCAKTTLALMAFCIYVSTRWVREDFTWRWLHSVLLVPTFVLSLCTPLFLPP